MSFFVNVQKDVTDLLKDLKDFEAIFETVYKSLKSRGFKFGILYGHCKVHKKSFDNCPPFRTLMSAIKAPTNNLAKF